MHSTGDPVFQDGKVVRLIGNTLDITEQENATQELQRSEAYLAEAQRLSHTGSFGWDVSSGEIFWSDETFRIFEIDPKTEITTELIVQRTHPDDRQAVQQVIERDFLRCSPSTKSINNAILKWNAVELEDAAAAEGLVLAKVRTNEEFRREPQYTEVLSKMPLITVEKIGDSEPVPLKTKVTIFLSRVSAHWEWVT